jgi:hypothetical protein
VTSSYKGITVKIEKANLNSSAFMAASNKSKISEGTSSTNNQAMLIKTANPKEAIISNHEEYSCCLRPETRKPREVSEATISDDITSL